MKYNTEQFVKKISAPIICWFDGEKHALYASSRIKGMF